MQNKIQKLIFILTIFLIVPNFAKANVTLTSGHWSSTYNCTDWVGGPTWTYLDCNGITNDLNNHTEAGNWEQITTSANFSGGAGGKGQRHWMGSGVTDNGQGDNDVSGGTKIEFNTPPTEFWFRWYARYQSGFVWTGGTPYYQKLMWIQNSNGTGEIPELWGSGFNFWADGSNIATNDNNVGWLGMYPTGISDGSWHFMEVHLKRSTNNANGVFEYWLDGVQKMNFSNLGFANNTTIKAFEWPSNQNNIPAGEPDRYMDIDDLAISTTGYIGPLVGGDTTPPSAPSGLAVQ